MARRAKPRKGALPRIRVRKRRKHESPSKLFEKVGSHSRIRASKSLSALHEAEAFLSPAPEPGRMRNRVLSDHAKLLVRELKKSRSEFANVEMTIVNNRHRPIDLSPIKGRSSNKMGLSNILVQDLCKVGAFGVATFHLVDKKPEWNSSIKGSQSSAPPPQLVREGKWLAKHVHVVEKLRKHIFPHLQVLHQRQLAQRKLWSTLFLLSKATARWRDKFQRTKIQRFWMTRREKMARVIQREWRASKKRVVQKRMRRNQATMMHFRILMVTLKCRWRTRVANTLRSFCKDNAKMTTRFGVVIRKFRYRVLSAQRICRDFLRCKAARLVCLTKLWDRTETNASWYLRSEIERSSRRFVRTRNLQGSSKRAGFADCRESGRRETRACSFSRPLWGWP